MFSVLLLFSPGLVTTDGFNSGQSAYYNSSGSTGNSLTHLSVAGGGENPAAFSFSTRGSEHCVCVCLQATSTEDTLHISRTVRTVTQPTRLPTQVGWRRRSRSRRRFETVWMTEVREVGEMSHVRGARVDDFILYCRTGQPERSPSPVWFPRTRRSRGGSSAEAEEVRALSCQPGPVRRKKNPPVGAKEPEWEASTRRNQASLPALISSFILEDGKTDACAEIWGCWVFSLPANTVDHLGGHWSPAKHPCSASLASLFVSVTPWMKHC